MTHHNITPELIRAALQHIPANLSRDEWARIIAAIKSELPNDTGYQLAKDWSETADNYNEKSLRDTWKSLKASGGRREDSRSGRCRRGDLGASEISSLGRGGAGGNTDLTNVRRRTLGVILSAVKLLVVAAQLIFTLDFETKNIDQFARNGHVCFPFMAVRCAFSEAAAL